MLALKYIRHYNLFKSFYLPHCGKLFNICLGNISEIIIWLTSRLLLIIAKVFLCFGLGTSYCKSYLSNASKRHFARLSRVLCLLQSRFQLNELQLKKFKSIVLARVNSYTRARRHTDIRTNKYSLSFSNLICICDIRIKLQLF